MFLIVIVCIYYNAYFLIVLTKNSGPWYSNTRFSYCSNETRATLSVGITKYELRVSL